MQKDMKKNIYNEVICPLCSSNRTKCMYTVNSGDVLRHLNFHQNENLRLIIEKLWNGNSSRFYKCKECTFSFAWPFVPGNSKFYSEIYSDINFYPKQKWDYLVTQNAINNLNKNTKLADFHLLEIGAGNGSFIKSISPELLPKENILCSEFSNYGKNEILSFGVNCISVDLMDIESSNTKNKFDIICMFQVLEHISRFDEYFKKINDITNKNAHLFLTVPNHKMREFYDSLNSKLDLPPIHVGRWNKKTFEILCKRYMWDLLEYKIENLGYFKKLRKFIFDRSRYYSFMKKTDSFSNKYIRKSFRLLIYIFILIFHLPSLIRLFATDMGVAQWVHLQKK